MARFRVSLLVALFLLSAALFVALPGSGGAQSVNHLVISEVMYDPLPPGAESDLEWAEIHNPAGAPITLNGWTLRDNTAQDTIPTFSLAPGAFLVIVANEAAFRGRYPSFSGNLVALGGPIGNGLSNTGDRLMLLDAQGREVDALSYGSDTTVFDPACPRVSEGQSLARVPSSQDTDSVADWAAQMSPNPGEAGVPPTATPSPTGTATPSPSATASATRTPTVSPSVGPTASPTHTAAPVATPTPTASPSPTNSPTASPKLLLSEVFYDAPQAGTDSDYEWVELFNPSAAPVDLAGWKLRDNTTEDAIPRFVLAPGEYLVVAATAAGFAANNPGFMGHLVSLEGSIGGGLGNTGDRVLLIAPDGTTTVDAMSYGSDIGGFNPACPNAPVGGSLARIPLAPDTDSAADWIVQHAPNPGAGVTAPIPTATRTPTPTSTVTPLWSPTSSATGTPTRTVTATSTGTPTPAATLFAQGIVLNEVLPDPDQIDWNGDGQARFDDEWIELYNLGAAPANLGGWAVADATQAYTIPLGTMIWPRGYLLLYRSQTHRTLGDDRGAVSLLRPDGGAADSFVYAVGPGADLSYCRSSDGSGAWLRGCLPTPGMANRGLPPPTAEKPPPEPSPDEDRDRDVRSGYAPAAPLTIAAARSTRDGTMATVAGRVTMLPGPLGRRIYLEDETGGIQVYLRRGEFPLMALGDQVRVTGWVAEFHGERQIEVSSADRIAVTGRDALLSPRRLRTSQIGEAHEGRLAWVFGRVVRASKSGVTLDDGSGPAYIYFPEELPWQHPYVKIGEMWGAQGVVGQYASQTPYADGYRLIPRLATDFSRAPLTLPATGVDFP